MSTILETLEDFRHLIRNFSDRSIRWLLRDNAYVQALVKLVAPQLLPFINFSRGMPQNRSFISKALEERESDVLLRVPFQHTAEDEELLIYILIEHQSTADPLMGLRMLSYMVQIWEAQQRDLEAKGVPKTEWRFQPILPILFYTGAGPWTPPVSVTTLMDLPEMLKRFVPTFDILFLGVNTTPAETLKEMDHPLGWLLSVLQQERADTVSLREALIEAVPHLEAFESPQGEHALLYCILLILHRRSAEEQEDLIAAVIQHSRNKSEVETMAQTAAQYLIEEGIAQGIEQGIERGARETTIENTVAILTARFPNADVSILQPALEAISDLNRLKQLNLNASLAESFRAFQHELET